MLPGLIARPPILPGFRRWQVATVTPRGEFGDAAWSPDGKYIACADYSAHVRVYRADTLQLVKVFMGHKGRVTSVAWSPDGNQLASGGCDGLVHLWHLDGRPGPVWAASGLGGENFPLMVRWSPDGKRLVAMGSGYANVYELDALPRKVGLRPFPSCSIGHQPFAWNPVNGLIASGHSDGTVRLWNSDCTAGPVLKGHSDMVYAVAWSPDGTRIASGGKDGQIRLWKSDGADLGVLEARAANGEITSIAWSPDGTRLAFGGRSREVHVWNLDETAEPLVIKVGTEQTRVRWSPDGEQILVFGRNLLSLRRADGTPISAVEGYDDDMGSLAWSPEGQSLASGVSLQGKIRLWQTDGTLQRVIDGHNREGPLAWSPDGEWLASGGIGSGPRLWRTDGVPGSELQTDGDGTMSLAWSPDGRWLASGGRKGEVNFWTTDGRPGAELEAHSGHVRQLAWSPDSRWLATVCGSDDTTAIKLWQPDGTHGAVLEGHQDQVRSMAWSPDGRWLAAGSLGTVRLHQHDGTVGPLIHPASAIVWSVSWSADGRWLASAGAGGLVYLHHPDGTPGPVLKGHRSPLRSVLWRADSQVLASTGVGRTIRLWTADWKPSHILEGYAGSAQSMNWRPDGKQLTAIVGACHDTIIAWDTETGEAQWSALVFPDGENYVTFSGDGRILHGDPKAIEKELVYIVENPDGTTQMLKPSEFRSSVAP